VVLESLVSDLGKEQSEALDLVVQHKQAAQIHCLPPEETNV
jgi:hypothetical protein